MDFQVYPVSYSFLVNLLERLTIFKPCKEIMMKIKSKKMRFILISLILISIILMVLFTNAVQIDNGINSKTIKVDYNLKFKEVGNLLAFAKK